MKNEIREHYREEDIQRMKLHSDIENWNAEIAFMEKEIVFFSTLLPSGSFQKANENQENTTLLLKRLKTTKEHNLNYAAAVLNFNNTLEGLNECEDLQCETYFLNSHEELRSKLEKHGLEFRNLKGAIFSHLEKNIED